MRALAGPGWSSVAAGSGRLPSPVVRPIPPPSIEMPTAPARFLGDAMSEILGQMCRRGGFFGSVIADAGGLPVADFNCPADPETVAACSCVMGEAMRAAGRFLRERETNNISMDIGGTNKVSVHRFEVGAVPYFLLVICPRVADERGEVEASVKEIAGILGHGGSGAPRSPGT